MNRIRNRMFFKRRERLEISEGDSFERSLAGSLVERAEVIWIGEDSFGIPHVRVNVSLMTPNRVEPQGVRLLAREAFASQFHPVPSAVAARRGRHLHTAVA